MNFPFCQRIQNEQKKKPGKKYAETKYFVFEGREMNWKDDG